MTKKFTLAGTDNDGFRHRYSVQKNEAFKKAFFKFMEILEFDSEIVKNTFVGSDREDNPIELKIADFEDCIRHYQNKKFDVDVFYGRFKIIIVVRTKKRYPMVKHLEKETGWVKTIELKKIKEKKKKSIPLLIK